MRRWQWWSGAALLVCGCASPPPPPAPAPAALSGHRAEDLPAPQVDEVPVTQETWHFGGEDGQVLSTSHYRLYTTLADHPILDLLPLFMERSLEHYTTGLARLPEPTAALDTYLFASRSQWEAKTRQMLPDQASTYLSMGRGGFTTRGTSVLYYIGRRDTLTILAHEGWHQYAQRTLRSQLPLWLDEGIAAYMEGHLRHPDGLPKFRPWANLERYDTLRDAVRSDRLIALPDLLERPPQDFLERGNSRLLVFYAQVWALVHFLAEGEGGRYRAGLQQVLVDAAQGQLSARVSMGLRQGEDRFGPAVMKTYFDPDLDGLGERFTAFMTSIVRTGGRDRITQGRNPME